MHDISTGTEKSNPRQAKLGLHTQMWDLRQCSPNMGIVQPHVDLT